MDPISVIIPTFNAADFIAETLDSVYSQTFQPKEILVIDDGSTDDTAQILASHDRVRLIRQANGGVYAALNNGIQLASYDLIAFLDHDDIWLPEKLEKQAVLMERQSDCKIVFTMLENYMPTAIAGIEAGQLNSPLMGIHKSTLMARKSVFEEVGLFEKSKIEILEWYAKAIDLQINQKFIKEVLVKRRIHGKNQSITDKSLRQEFPRIIKSILDRRSQSEEK